MVNYDYRIADEMLKLLTKGMLQIIKLKIAIQG